MTKNTYRFMRCIEAVQKVAKERFPFALALTSYPSSTIDSYKDFYSFINEDEFIDEIEGKGGSLNIINQFNIIMDYTLEILSDMDFIKLNGSRVLFYPELLSLEPFELIGNVYDDEDK